MPRRATNLPLSFVITGAVSGALALATLCAVTVGYVLHETTVEELALQRSDHERESARQRLMAALLDQEVGHRSMIATGNPTFLEAYQAGVRAEAEAWAQVRTLHEPAPASPALERLHAAVARWHDQVVGPQLLRARSGPLPELAAALQEGKACFDAIRQAMAALADDETARSEARRAGLQRHEQRTTWAGAVLLALLAASATLLLAWGHRRVAVPLRALAAQVESGTRLDPATGVSPIREVATLRDALLRLDRRVAEREAVLRTEREDAELLGRFAEIVQQTTSEAELYRLLVRFLESAVSPAGATLFSLNPSENHLAMVHPSRSADDQYRLPIVSEPARCRAIRSARNVLVAQGDDPGTCECALACASSYCCLPLMATGQVIGLVSLQAAPAVQWTARQVHLAQSLVSTASTTLNSIRLLARSRDNALRDSLTRAYNRRFLSEVLPKLVHQATRSKAPLSALMIDVDKFKDFNDRHGHDAGDRVLAAVARCLSEQIRMSDTLVRYGGEEFAILLPNTSAENARILAERAREAVASLRTAIPQSDRPLSVNISVGVAALPDQGSTGEDLLLAADKALFRAKETGRNRVIAAPVRSEPPRAVPALALAPMPAAAHAAV
jgi:diguanylate cyclase (GGDEF)-like protein